MALHMKINFYRRIEPSRVHLAEPSYTTDMLSGSLEINDVAFRSIRVLLILVA